MKNFHRRIEKFIETYVHTLTDEELDAILERYRLETGIDGRVMSVEELEKILGKFRR